MSEEVRKLALSIGSCDNYLEVLNGGTNSCSSVVNWQADQHEYEEIERRGMAGVFHRPEPWAGNLKDAPIMFLSSNPSFDSRENFPTLEWQEDDAFDFFANRFSQEASKPYGASEGPKFSDFDRAILKDGSRTPKVRTWHGLRSRASILLNQKISETFASQHYVMTEVVHCKSQKEVGVSEALPVCVSKWFKPMLAVSSARLIVVSGSHAGKAVKYAVTELTGGVKSLDDNWGSWQGTTPALGRWPKSWSELEQWRANGDWTINHQEDHIEDIVIDLGGQERTFTFMWMPHVIRSVPQKIDDQRLYDPAVLANLRSIVRQ